MTSDLRSMRDAARRKKRDAWLGISRWQPPVKEPIRRIPPQSMEQRAEELEEREKSVLAFPFKRKYGDRYAAESKRLAQTLGIQVLGLPANPNPRQLNREKAVYAAIGQALHSLPSVAWPWVERFGKNISFEVTPKGIIYSPVDSVKNPAAGYYMPGDEFRRLPRGRNRRQMPEQTSQRIRVGAPKEMPYYYTDMLRKPGTPSSRKQTIDYVRGVAIHEFAHWLDWESNRISAQHPELFGNVTNPRAPHDQRQWERFANSLESYLNDHGERDKLDKNVVKFFDRFIGSQLSYDSEQPDRRPIGHRERQRRLVKRISALKILFTREVIPPMSPALLEKDIKELESIMKGE